MRGTTLIEDKYKKALNASRDYLCTGMENWQLAQEFRKNISWHIPTQSLVDELKKYSPIVSVGSGHAYTEFIAKQQDVDIIATDICPSKENKWCKGEKLFMPVEQISAKKAIQKYPGRNVFLAWPPYDKPMGYEVAKAMKPERILIYIGESEGGCTADDKFYQYIAKSFNEIKTDVDIERWWGLHDYVQIYQKKFCI
jgi:hypothetical protein